MSIRIVKAESEHVHGIQEVFYRTWLDTYPNKEFGITIDDVEDRFKGRNSTGRIEKRRRDIENPVPGRKFLIALDGEKVIGVCCATKGQWENRLDAIYILPEYQGTGVGTQLWKQIEKFFGRSKDILVGVATYNDRAINFYRKLGFIDSGHRYTEERLRMKSGAVLPEMDMVLKASAK